MVRIYQYFFKIGNVIQLFVYVVTRASHVPTGFSLFWQSLTMCWTTVIERYKTQKSNHGDSPYKTASKQA